jgi:hypothetical protein
VISFLASPSWEIGCWPRAGWVILSSAYAFGTGRVQSWIGILIPAARFCLLLKAQAFIRKGESRHESFTKAM